LRQVTETDHRDTGELINRSLTYGERAGTGER
jgi:hypothetical protein